MDRKRGALPFDTEYFKKESDRGIRYSTRDAFAHIYRTNLWGGDSSRSGQGSDGGQTIEVAAALRRIVKAYGIRVLLDLPCGDFNWMKNAGLAPGKYVGGDIVPELIARNTELHGGDEREFVVLDITADPLPAADLLLCRDCLVHFSNVDVMRALDNVRKSRIRYLLATTFTGCGRNVDIVTGDWRIMNLTAPPFSLPPPLELVNEHCTEGGGTYADKCLGLWQTADL
jgi:hypothetical protein